MRLSGHDEHVGRRAALRARTWLGAACVPVPSRSSKNLGRSGRERGHKREPTPPAGTTAVKDVDGRLRHGATLGWKQNTITYHRRRTVPSLPTLYRGREGMWMWVVHRATGVAIFFFLLIHILDTSLVRISPEAYNDVIGSYKRRSTASSRRGSSRRSCCTLSTACASSSWTAGRGRLRHQRMLVVDRVGHLRRHDGRFLAAPPRATCLVVRS